jgi:hypothetical protein
MKMECAPKLEAGTTLSELQTRWTPVPKVVPRDGERDNLGLEDAIPLGLKRV